MRKRIRYPEAPYDKLFEARAVNWERRLERMLVEMDLDLPPDGTPYQKDFHAVTAAFQAAIRRMRRDRHITKYKLKGVSDGSERSKG